MRYLSHIVVWSYRMGGRIQAKLFSILISGAFAAFGRRSVLVPPIRFAGERRIVVGHGVFVGAGSWLQTLPDPGNNSPAIRLGDRVSVSGACVISAARSVIIESDVLLARNVYISDHSHRFQERERPVLAQGIDKIASVHIKRGAWLGQNVVVCPGVTIGQNAVIGANSVVNQDVPDFAVAVGAPARIVRTREKGM